MTIGAQESKELSNDVQASILLAEYNRLCAETRMHVEQLSPKFTIYAIFVLSGFAFAFQNPAHQIIFAIIPVFILMISYVAISHWYMIVLLRARLRSVESGIQRLNGGTAILDWERGMVVQLVFPAVIRIELSRRTPSRIVAPNPILVAVIFMAVGASAMITYSTWRSYQLIPVPWNLAYTIFTGLCFLAMCTQAFSFFFANQRWDQIEDSIEHQA